MDYVAEGDVLIEQLDCQVNGSLRRADRSLVRPALKGMKMMKTRAEFACRVRELREELYGIDGLEALARTLGVPAQTWLNYERGVTMPADLLLEFLVLTER